MGVYLWKSFKAFEESVRSSLGSFYCIEAIACLIKLMITKQMSTNRMQSDTAKRNTYDEVHGRENDLSPDGFLPSKSKMDVLLRHRCVYLSGEKFQLLDIWITYNNWKNTTQNGSPLGHILFDTLYEDENEGL